MKFYAAVGAVLGFIFGCVTGPFVAWFVAWWIGDRVPSLAGSGTVFFGLWAANTLLATPAFAAVGALQRRFEIFLDGEKPRQDPW